MRILTEHDLMAFTEEKLVLHKFASWTKLPDGTQHLLIPIELEPHIKYGSKFIAINGEEIVFDENTDLDTRFGLLAFGFFHKPQDRK
jgi:hypothetical protein